MYKQLLAIKNEATRLERERCLKIVEKMSFPIVRKAWEVAQK